jgi:serpin B
MKSITTGLSKEFQKRFLLIVVFSLCLILLASPSHAGNRDTLVNDNTRFAFDLYKQIANSDKENGNVFISPFSISVALGMTYAAARGNTEEEMAKAMRFSLSQDQLHSAFSELLSGLKGSKDFELAIANRLWGQKGYKILPAFKKIADTNYQGGLQEVDFAGNPEPSRKVINDWVEEMTRKKIQELLVKGDIKDRTRLVLTNAIYFKGNWFTKFKPSQTRDSVFFLSDQKTVPVPLMSQKGRYHYYLRQDGLEILELPYAGKKLSMLLVLPSKGTVISKAEQVLTVENFRKWRSSMSDEEVMVFLPKFTMTLRFVLNDALSAMGMPDAFTDSANFSGISGKPDLYISKVIHKAFVDVNEEGTEAAAATAVVIDTKSASQPIIFRADRPFIFTIIDRESGSILFLGRLINPAQK